MPARERRLWRHRRNRGVPSQSREGDSPVTAGRVECAAAQCQNTRVACRLHEGVSSSRGGETELREQMRLEPARRRAHIGRTTELGEPGHREARIAAGIDAAERLEIETDI